VSVWDEKRRFRVWQADKIWEAENENQDGSVVAWSTTFGDVVPHGVHAFALIALERFGSTLNTSRFLQTGQTKAQESPAQSSREGLYDVEGLGRFFLSEKKVAWLG